MLIQDEENNVRLIKKLMCEQETTLPFLGVKTEK